MTGNRHDFCPTCGASYPQRNGHHLGCPRYGDGYEPRISIGALLIGSLITAPIWLAILVCIWANSQ